MFCNRLWRGKKQLLQNTAWDFGIHKKQGQCCRLYIPLKNACSLQHPRGLEKATIGVKRDHAADPFRADRGKPCLPIPRPPRNFPLGYAQPDIASHLRIPSFNKCGHIVEIAFCGLKVFGRKTDDDCDMIRRIAIINRIEQNDIADCWPCLHAFPQPKRIEFCPFLPAAHPTKTMRHLFCFDRQIIARKQNAVIYKCSMPTIA